MNDFVKRLRKVAVQTGGYGCFAKLINVKTRTAYKFLEGKKVPDIEVLKRIGESCDVSLDWLLTGRNTECRKG